MMDRDDTRMRKRKYSKRPAGIESVARRDPIHDSVSSDR